MLLKDRIRYFECTGILHHTQLSIIQSFPSVYNFASYTICIYISTVFNSCRHGKNGTLHIKRSTTLGGNAAMTYEIIFLVSRLPLCCIPLCHFLVFYVYFIHKDINMYFVCLLKEEASQALMSINTGHSSPTLQFHIRALVLSITKLFMNASPLIGKELLYYDFRLNLFHKWLTYFSAHMLQPYLSHYTIKISIL